MNGDLVFENPPGNGRGSRGIWKTRLATIAEHPGIWVNVSKTWGTGSKNPSGSVPIIRRDAKEMGLSIETRLSTLVVPGEVHLFVRVVPA